MRITNSMLVRNMMVNLNSNLRKMEKYQKQMASGKQFQLPSENPIGMSKSLKLYTDISKVEQYQSNLKDAQAWMHTTEDALSSLGEILKRAKELTIDAANGNKTDDDRRKILEEVTQLKEQIIQIANTNHAGRSVFTGYKTDKDLLDKDGNYIIDLSSDELSKYNIGISEDMIVNTVGIGVFGVEGEADGGFREGNVNVGNKSYFVDVFQRLENALDSTDPKDVDSFLSEIEVLHGNVLSKQAEIGAKNNRLDMTEKRLTSDELNFTGVLSHNEDVDPAEVIMNLKMAEMVYMASMAAGTRIIQPTLVDFLR